MPTASIFIKSYPGDFKWLAYCLKSLAKFATGFEEIVVCIPEGAYLNLTLERVLHLPEIGDGYMFQQVAKLNADLHTNSDYVLHIDSDSVLREPVTPETFMLDGKPLWLMTPFKDAHPEEQHAWLHVMTKCLRQPPEFEFMRRNTMFVPRWAYGCFRDFIQRTHGISMESYVMSQPAHEFSEYNCLGQFLYTYHRGHFRWWDTSAEGVPRAPERQFWSWGGLTDDIRKEIDEILA